MWIRQLAGLPCIPSSSADTPAGSCSATSALSGAVATAVSVAPGVVSLVLSALGQDFWAYDYEISELN